MGVKINPSDLYYRYQRKKATRELPKFTGKPDPRPFDREDLYEVLPMFEAVMDALETNDGRILNHLEEILINGLPACVSTREEVYDCLYEGMRELLDR